MQEVLIDTNIMKKVKNEILSVKSGEKMFSDIELIRKIIEIPFVRRKIQALSITKKYHDEIIALKKVFGVC